MHFSNKSDVLKDIYSKLGNEQTSYVLWDLENIHCSLTDFQC